MRMRKNGDEERGCGFLRFLSPSRSSLFLLYAVKKVDSAGTHRTLRMSVGSRLADANILSVPLYTSASVRCWNGRLLSAVPVVGQGADTRCFPHLPWVFAGNSLRASFTVGLAAGRRKESQLGRALNAGAGAAASGATHPTNGRCAQQQRS